jgi:hypothetical protein
VATYAPPQNFRAWADATGYRNVLLFSPVIRRLNFGDPHVQTTSELYDMNRNGLTSASPFGAQRKAEQTYWDLDFDGFVSDDERDEDSDGLINYHETTGPMTAGWWAACYPTEGEYPIKYAGTKPFDADSDGDGILDGADDQDNDGVPNIMELSRNMAGNVPLDGTCAASGTYNSAAPPTTWVNPFNPCLPDEFSRTCQRHPQMSAPYAPFNSDWIPLVLNSRASERFGRGPAPCAGPRSF